MVRWDTIKRTALFQRKGRVYYFDASGTLRSIPAKGAELKIRGIKVAPNNRLTFWWEEVIMKGVNKTHKKRVYNTLEEGDKFSLFKRLLEDQSVSLGFDRIVYRIETPRFHNAPDGSIDYAVVRVFLNDKKYDAENFRRVKKAVMEKFKNSYKVRRAKLTGMKIYKTVETENIIEFYFG